MPPYNRGLFARESPRIVRRRRALAQKCPANKHVRVDSERSPPRTRGRLMMKRSRSCTQLQKVHLRGRSSRGCTRRDEPMPAGRGDLPDCGAWRTKTIVSSSNLPAREIQRGSGLVNSNAYQMYEHCGPDCSSGVLPPTTPAGQLNGKSEYTVP
jgi:hypothetical protein